MKTIVEAAYETPLVSFTLASPIGTAFDSEGEEGLVCHSAELGMRGTRDWDRRDFDEKLDSLGAGMGFSFRRDSLSLSGTCLHRHLETLIGLATQVLECPALTSDEHEKLQRETLADLDEMRDSDASLAARFFNLHFHPGYTYCRTALGTPDSIAALEVETVRDLYPRLFPEQHLVLGFAGPVDDKEANTLASRFTGQSQSESLPAPNLQPPSRLPGRRLILVDKPGRKQCQVAIGHLMPAYGSETFDALRIAEAAFGGMFTSRLMQEIRVKQSWSYGASCNIFHARGAHALCINMAPAADVCALAVDKVLGMYSSYAAEGLHQDEFEFSRSYLSGSAAFTRATATQRLYRKVQEQLYGLPVGYGDGFAKRLQSLDRKSVNQALSKSASPDNLCVVVVGTAETVLAPLQALGFDSVEVVDYKSY